MEDVEEIGKELKVCRNNIQRETCRKCIFEVLCDYEDMIRKIEGKEIKERFINKEK